MVTWMVGWSAHQKRNCVDVIFKVCRPKKIFSMDFINIGLGTYDRLFLCLEGIIKIDEKKRLTFDMKQGHENFIDYVFQENYWKSQQQKNFGENKAGLFVYVDNAQMLIIII